MSVLVNPFTSTCCLLISALFEPLQIPLFWVLCFRPFRHFQNDTCQFILITVSLNFIWSIKYPCCLYNRRLSVSLHPAYFEAMMIDLLHRASELIWPCLWSAWPQRGRLIRAKPNTFITLAEQIESLRILMRRQRRCLSQMSTLIWTACWVAQSPRHLMDRSWCH